MNTPEEPLLESAPIAWQAARRLCGENAALGGNCSWYHGFWQTLRVLDLVATPAHHATFLNQAFSRAVAPASRPRVLICGAIDYSTLAHVITACAALDAQPDVTVVEVCETPLFLNTWYADRAGIGIRTFCTDILHFQEPGRYDVICTHSFFGQIPPHLRAALLSRWRELLRPGGKVITVNRIRPESENRQVGFSAGQAQTLRHAILEAPEDLKNRLGITGAELAGCADAYVARRRPHPVRSEEEFRRLFEEGGFIVEQLACAPIAGRGKRLGGPTTLDGSSYAQIVARRP